MDIHACTRIKGIGEGSSSDNNCVASDDNSRYTFEGNDVSQ
jgi:hypothetical protein